jgi:hypothetical protein
MGGGLFSFNGLLILSKKIKERKHRAITISQKVHRYLAQSDLSRILRKPVNILHPSAT